MQVPLQPGEFQNPKPFEYVIVETSQGRYVGFMDDDGQWFRATTDSVLSGVQRWYPAFSTPAKPRIEDVVEESEIVAEVDPQ